MMPRRPYVRGWVVYAILALAWLVNTIVIRISVRPSDDTLFLASIMFMNTYMNLACVSSMLEE